MKVTNAAILLSVATAVLASLPAATANASGSRLIFTLHAKRSPVRFVKDTAPKGKINAGDVQRFTEKVFDKSGEEGSDVFTIKYGATTMTVNGTWTLGVLGFKAHGTFPYPPTSTVMTLKAVGTSMALGSHGTVTIKPAAHGYTESFNMSHAA
jgi:hypothetical protein